MIAMTGDRRLAAPRIAVLAIAALPATALGIAVQIWAAVVEHGSVPFEVLDALPVAAFVVVGLVVVAARPANRVGWWMVVGGVLSALGGAGVALAHHGLAADPGSVPAAGTFAIGGQAVRTLGWIAMTLVVPVLFPTGRVMTARWRWLNTGIVVVCVAGVLDPIFDAKADLDNLGTWHNPLAPTGPWQLVVNLPIFVAHFPLSAVLTVAAVVQLVQRWRRGDEFQRQQLLLFACAVGLTVISAPVAIWVGGGNWIFAVTSLPLPIAVGFAILAHGLYDLRTAANRTLVWLTLSITVAGVLALVIGVGGLLGRSASTPWLSWVAAGVAAACFAPLRDVLQRGVNRLTYGKWTEPYELLAELGQQLEASSDVDRLLADVAAELHELGLRDVRILAADSPDRADPSVGVEDDASADRIAIPLSAYGALVGTLSYREGEAPLRPRDRRLLEDLAGHLGGVLHSRLLMHDLQRARERLVLGREEERRRLRRDLHDGLGPALAGHLLRLDVIARRLPSGSEAGQLVDTLRDELRDTVQDVRRLVEGLRPPALDELGLDGALRQVVSRLSTGSAVTTTVHCDSAPNLPAAIEVAAYRIATEAMTNVIKHANARNCTVDVRIEPDALVVRVQDDGSGLSGAGPGRGHGMRTMRERAEELRGSFDASSQDLGTVVVARLPLTGVASAAVTAPAADLLP
jgi:signal transduction histidine kinase